MLASAQPVQVSRRSRWFALSVAVHLGVLGVLMIRPEPRFVQPKLVRAGQNGKSTALVYMAANRPEEKLSESKEPTRPAKITLPKQKPKPIRKPAEAEHMASATPSEKPAGSPHGSMYDAVMAGHDVRPALPVVAPDPPVSRAEIDGLEGDVIVEVTIDESGQVTAAKLLQGIGRGIEEKVVAAVRMWKFSPATEDGVPIASRQDVHFHYPS
jgi:TonB family protein